jgi:hypothetical protein
MIQVVEDGHLAQGLHVLEVFGAGKILPFPGKEVGRIKPKATANENDPLRGRFFFGCRPQVEGMQGEGESRPDFKEIFSANISHGRSPSIE